MQTSQDNTTGNLQRRNRREANTDRYIVLRNILNIIFMVGAVIGVIIYFKGSHDTGTIIILVSMVFKIVECVFRFIK